MSDANPGRWAWSVDAYGGALEKAHLDLPTPGPGELLVKVEAAALNPLDLKLIRGDLKAFMPTTFPFTPGSDVCGTVAAVGEGVEHYRPGDRVVALTPDQGGMADHVICRVGPSTVAAPSDSPATDLASLPEAGLTALSILDAASVTPGIPVAVIGATGGIGLLLCQLLRAEGATVIATAAEADHRLMLDHGAHETIDHTREDVTEALSRRPDGAPLVLVDLINQGEDLVRSAEALHPQGRLVSTLFGPDPAAFIGREVRYVRLSPREGQLQRLVTSVAQGWLRPFVSQTFGFDQTPLAYAALAGGHVRGKLVVEMEKRP